MHQYNTIISISVSETYMPFHIYLYLLFNHLFPPKILRKRHIQIILTDLQPHSPTPPSPSLLPINNLTNLQLNPSPFQPPWTSNTPHQYLSLLDIHSTQTY